MKLEEQCEIEIIRFNESLRRIATQYQNYAKSVGLSPIAIEVLEVLYYYPEFKTQKEICNWTGFQKQAVNLVVRNFWEQGYVELQEVRNDRRNKNLILSPTGRAFAKEIFGKVEVVEMEMWLEMTKEERQLLEKVMLKYEAAFQKL